MSAEAAAERADAVVVGARCAGSATAIALARAGRRVVVLDRARFPADTLSTHLLFPAGVQELQRLGALPRVQQLGAPPLTHALIGGAGLTASAAFSAGHGLCVRRTGLDAALVETARAAGADVREATSVIDLVWRDGRVAGVRWKARDDSAGEIRAPLVVGADGRRSTVARLAGATSPYRENANGRACVYAYVEERRPERRHVAAQWRAGAELGTAFPCDGGLILVLLMPPVQRAAGFRADLAGEFARTVALLPGLAERLDGAQPVDKVRSATDLPSYFRRSTGPGWALPGDAGHFKDPVTAQGIRDALRFGRLVGEAAAPTLHDPAALQAALIAWERRRERECLETYQWTNQLARAEAITPLEVELYRVLAADPGRTQQMLDVFARRRAPSEVLTPALGLRLIARALARRGTDRRAVARTAARDLRRALTDRRERARATRHPVTHARPHPPDPAVGADGRAGARARPRAAARDRVAG